MRKLSPESIVAFDGAEYVAALLEQRQPDLQRICSRWAEGHRADAEDLLAEACLRALQAISREGAPFDNPLGWLTTTVRNLARDRQRSPEQRQRSDIMLDSWPVAGPDALDACAARELLQRALTELRRLPPAQRLALLARTAGDDYSTIASRLDTSPQNARKLVQTARNALRERLGLGH